MVREAAQCLGVGLMLSASPWVFAGTNLAASASYVDVSNALAASVNGDTVLLPGGNAVWSNQLLVTKNVTIRGNGTNAGTTITVTTGPAIRFNVSLDSPYRATQIAFVAAGAAQAVYLNNVVRTTQARIDHCSFSGFTGKAIYVYTGDYGVIDHCSFYGGDTAIMMQEGASGATAWSRPAEPGTTNALYIENCLFFDDTGPGLKNPLDEFLYNQCGARVVLRNSTIDSRSSSQRSAFDMHGAMSGGLYGCVLGESYSNHIHLANGNNGYAFGFRGGTQIHHDNTFVIDTAGPAIKLTDESAFWGLGTSYPSPNQITNSFFWDNIYSGQVVFISASDYSPPSSFFIQQNREFWFSPPSATNGSPTGAYGSYAPLVYPHPLVAAQDIASMGPTSNPPVMSLNPSSIDYGSIAVGTVSNVSIVVKNLGGSTLIGSATVQPPFSLEGATSYSLSNSQSQVVVVRFAPQQVGISSGAVSFTGGGSAVDNVFGAAYPVFDTLSFDSAAGLVSPPFVTNTDGSISQPVEVNDPAAGGLAVYGFNVASAGDYCVSANVYAPNEGANSFFVNIDAEPTTNMVWSVAVFSGFTSQFVTWMDSQAPTSWSLQPGLHRLMIRGREAGAKLGAISLLSRPDPPGRVAVVSSYP